MLWHIIRKELLAGFLSLRFSFTLILVAVIIISSAFLFIEDYQQQREDYDRNVHDNWQGLSGLVGVWNSIYFVFSFYPRWVYQAPTRLAFLAEGNEKTLPNAFQVNAFTIQGPTKKLRGNHLLLKFEDVDWAFVVSVIMSFAAIVLIYDSISGEREDGTLRLSMSNSVPPEHDDSRQISWHNGCAHRSIPDWSTCCDYYHQHVGPHQPAESGLSQDCHHGFPVPIIPVYLRRAWAIRIQPAKVVLRQSGSSAPGMGGNRGGHPGYRWQCHAWRIEATQPRGYV